MAGLGMLRFQCGFWGSGQIFWKKILISLIRGNSRGEIWRHSGGWLFVTCVRIITVWGAFCQSEIGFEHFLSLFQLIFLSLLRLKSSTEL